MNEATGRILAEVSAERHRQEEKWGEQNHPSLDRILMERLGGCTPERMAEEYGIPTADVARSLCQRIAEYDQVTWPHILIEEVAEAVEAGVLAGEPAMRDELVQVAAVAVAWIEAIDRRCQEDTDG